jgi:hypothetical protein
MEDVLRYLDLEHGITGTKYETLYFKESACAKSILEAT